MEGSLNIMPLVQTATDFLTPSSDQESLYYVVVLVSLARTRRVFTWQLASYPEKVPDEIAEVALLLRHGKH